MATTVEGRSLEDEDTSEQLDDVQSLNKLAFNVVLASSDWTADTMLSQIAKDNIYLDPLFQRRAVWRSEKRSRFIESLILGVPVPQLVLASRDRQSQGSSFIVIDGKQRLLTLKSFGCAGSAQDAEPLKLKGLQVLKDINNKTYDDLRTDPQFREYVEAFENAIVRTVVIKNWKKEEYLYQTFFRINSGSVTLSPQELRQALHPGKFSEFILLKSAESEEIRKILNNPGADFRMRDAEILLRYIAYKNFMKEYKGNLKKFLDNATLDLNKSWQKMSKTVEFQVDQMNEAYKFTRNIFGQNYMCKSTRSGYERPRNRAVIDIMLHYFSCPKVRNAIGESNKKKIKKTFEDLCNEKDFEASFSVSTKSLKSNRIRFNYWGEAIEKLTKLNLNHMKFPV